MSTQTTNDSKLDESKAAYGQRLRVWAKALHCERQMMKLSRGLRMRQYEKLPLWQYWHKRMMKWLRKHNKMELKAIGFYSR